MFLLIYNRWFKWVLNIGVDEHGRTRTNSGRTTLHFADKRTNERTNGRTGLSSSVDECDDDENDDGTDEGVGDAPDAGRGGTECVSRPRFVC